MDEPFSRYHPAITFLFFIAAIVFAMFFVHPAYLLADLVFACLFFLLIKGSSGLKFLGGMAVLVVVLTFLNPLFNTSGPTVLFTYFGGRPYTLEALLYGLAIAVMFATVLIWFACYNATMSSDKFIYLFGKFAPSVSLVLTMVLRLVPNYRRQADKISSARMCVGKSPSEGTRKEKLGNGVTVLSAMTSWALEGGIVTGDSMRSRGYGTGPRSNFAIFRMDSRDKTMLGVMIAMIVVVIAAAVHGCMYVTYTPTFAIAPVDWVAFLGITAYSVLLAIPSAVHIWEEARWRISRSRI